jgi:glycine/D-amino acid oxidase-like deaminating enzyme
MTATAVDSYDALVVGAGGVGLATAFHLAKLGRSVLLIDKAEIASETSARAAGMLSLIQSDEVRSQVVQRSVDQMAAFEDLAGVALPHTRGGTLKLARTEQTAAYVRADLDRASEFGVAIRLVDAAEAAEIAPFVDGAGAAEISYTPDDVYFEPEALLAAMRKGADLAGVEMRSRCALLRLEQDGGCTRAVTTQGDVLAGAVVIAAGAWGPRIASEHGIELPVVPVRHQLVVTEPVAGVERGHPAITIVDDNVYMRPCRDGLLIGGYEPEPLQLRSDQVDVDYSMTDLELDGSPVEALRAQVGDVVPVAATAGVAELRGGLPTMTPDNMFIVDRISEPLNLHIVCGCCVSGLSTSLSIGEAVAARVHGDQPRFDLDVFSLKRFPSLPDAFENLYERTAWAYAHHQEID